MRPSTKPSGQKKAAKDVLFFKRFILSAITFVIAMSAIVYVNLLLPPSELQELVALLGLILAIPSGLCAFFYYLKILWNRLQNFNKH